MTISLSKRDLFTVLVYRFLFVDAFVFVCCLLFSRFYCSSLTLDKVGHPPQVAKFRCAPLRGSPSIFTRTARTSCIFFALVVPAYSQLPNHSPQLSYSRLVLIIWFTFVV